MAIIILHQLAIGNTISVTKKYLDFCINKVLSVLADIDNYHTLLGYIGFVCYIWSEENISFHKTMSNGFWKPNILQDRGNSALELNHIKNCICLVISYFFTKENYFK